MGRQSPKYGWEEWEALQEGWYGLEGSPGEREGCGGPPGGPKGLGGTLGGSGGVGRHSQRAGRGREALPESWRVGKAISE